MIFRFPSLVSFPTYEICDIDTNDKFTIRQCAHIHKARQGISIGCTLPNGTPPLGKK